MTDPDVKRIPRQVLEESAHTYGPFVARDTSGAYWRCDESGWTTLGTASGSEPPDPVEVPVMDAPPAKDPAPVARSTGDPDGPPARSALETATAIIERLRADFHAGRLSSRVAEASARDVLLLDVEGGVWMAGLGSGDWYRWKDGSWKRGVSPDPGHLVRFTAGAHRCPVCGTVNETDGACGSCGTLPTPTLDAAPGEAADGLQAFLLQAEAPLLPERMTPVWSPPEQ